MRYAVVSDIHANWYAWNATLLDIRSDGVDCIICLGDIIGYGPQPATVLESVHANVDHMILGNHDAALCGKLDDEGFNEEARVALDWTRRHVNDDALKFLSCLPLTLDGGIFRCAHSEFEDPGSYHYVIDPEDAVPSWMAVSERLLFVGHTHDPAIFILGPSGVPRKAGLQDFVLEEEKRFLVSVGSVGQPRDGDTRACYCIFDSDEKAVYWRRVPFDIDAYRESLERSGLPLRPNSFLRYDPRASTPPLRELLSFAPPEEEGHGVKDAVLVADISAFKKRIARWKCIAVGACAVSLMAAVSVGVGAYRYANKAVVIDGIGLETKSQPESDDENLLALATVPAHETTLPMPGWKICLGDGRRQSVSLEQTEDDGLVWRLVSGARKEEVRIVSRKIAASSGGKYCVEGLFRKSPGFSGTIVLVVSVARAGANGEEVLDQFVVKEPVLNRRQGWLAARQTFLLPARTTEFWCEVRGTFTGEVLIKPIVLSRQN